MGGISALRDFPIQCVTSLKNFQSYFFLTEQSDYETKFYFVYLLSMISFFQCSSVFLTLVNGIRLSMIKKKEKKQPPTRKCPLLRNTKL